MIRLGLYGILLNNHKDDIRLRQKKALMGRMPISADGMRIYRNKKKINKLLLYEKWFNTDMNDSDPHPHSKVDIIGSIFYIAAVPVALSRSFLMIAIYSAANRNWNKYLKIIR
jgi:hypothetical protein